MLQKIKAIIVNRNLVTTLKNTVDFLSKDSRVEVIIFDQQSTYPPLLEYYKTQNVLYNNSNGGPYSAWGIAELNRHHYIVTDADCTYDDVPDDWLDKMLYCLDNSGHNKVGFSLKIDDLPDNVIANQAKQHESKFWTNSCQFGWVGEIDTTFALYRAGTAFQYQAVRLFEPYTIKHVPWYIENDMNEEWEYYLKHSSGISVWGSRLKTLYNL